MVRKFTARNCSLRIGQGNVLFVAFSVLQLVALQGVSSIDINGGIYISCGRGSSFMDTSNRTWAADFNYTAGDGYSAGSDLKISGAMDSAVYRSMRFFGAQLGPINSYSIKVASSGYHLVRLHFAEILLTTASQRSFHVHLNGVRALENFTLPGINQAIMKEFYIPILNGLLDITFVRGKLGDPMINAIEVVPAAGLYGLDPISKTILASQIRLDCGSNTSSGPDMLGRLWASDTGLYQSSGTPIDTVVNATKNGRSGVDIKGINEAPVYLPEEIYTTTRQVDNSGNSTSRPLVYTLQSAKGGPYFLRLHFVELQVDGESERQISISINKKLVTSNLDVFKEAGAQNALTRDFSIAKTTSNFSNITIELQANASLPVPDPMLSALELFQILNTTDAALNATTSIAPVPYAIPPPPESSQVNFLQGIAIGVAAMVGLFGVAGALLIPRLWRRHVAQMKEKDQQRAGLLDAHGHHLDHSGEGSVISRVGNRMGTRVFTIDELQLATDNFSSSNVIGRGGFGQVYKADIGSGMIAAVKKLEIGSQQGEREFLTEVELLSRLHHRNLVNLLGYCEESGNLMLVYEYVPNGTLRDFLKSEDKALQLAWPARVSVALGAAKGIEYLHRGATPPVIHRDIKSTNILLDDHFQAKVADFGLSRLAGDTAHQMNVTHITTGVKGTLGYLDPLYYRNHQLTEKSDVYSFGVVLLEIITGKMAIWRENAAKSSSANKSSTANSSSYKPPTNPFMEEEDEPEEHISNIVEWAMPALEAGDVARIAAPELHEIPPEHLPSMQVLAKVAASCVKLQAKDRPTMSDVVRELEYCASIVVDSSLLRSEDFHPSQPSQAAHRPLGLQRRLQAPAPLTGVALHAGLGRDPRPLPTLPRVLEAPSSAHSSPVTSPGGQDGQEIK